MIPLMTIRVLFVCLGNICRSPTAEGIVRAHLQDAGLADAVKVDSAGTGGWHVGDPPDARAIAAAKARGVDLSHQRARQVTRADFYAFDRIEAMDAGNLAALRAMAPSDSTARLGLFLENAPALGRAEVPDPYFEGGFDGVVTMVEAASAGLVAHLKAQGRGGPKV